MRRLLFTLMLLLAPLALAQTVYKWVDEDGQVHYSDQPHPSAEKIHVKAIQTYKSSQAGVGGPAIPGATAAPGEPPVAAQNAPAYQGCAIAEPGDGATFTNVDSLTVVVQTDPLLRSGDKVYVSLDGAALNGGNPTGPTFNISPVERGQHSVAATVRDAQGAVLCQTPGVTFQVHMNSVLNPANPIAKPH
jgi:hypothetical protein